MFRKLLLLSTTTLGFMPFAMAQDHEHGHENEDTHGFYAHLDTRTYVTAIINADDNNEEVSDIFTHSHGEIGYGFGNGLSVNSTVSLEGEPLGHSHGGVGADPTQSRFFDDTVLFIEQLTLNYDTDHYGFAIGKLNPRLGLNIHEVPGWWGPLVFEEFKIREQIGGSVYVATDIENFGEQRLDVATFFADTSLLNESVLYDRNRLNGGEGGAGNTENFNSFSVNLSGELRHDYLGYYLGFSHRGVDISTEKDERRFVVGLRGAYPVTESLTLSAMTDMTDITHLDGESDHDRRYTTIGANADYNQWVVGGTYTDINNDSADPAEGADGYITQISAGYNFENGIGTDLGYVWQKEEGEKKQRLGLSVRYSAEF